MSPADEQSLVPLLGKSELLVQRRGRMYVKDKLDIPCDEFGLPLREQFIRDVLATIIGPHIWTGEYDIHHLVWHREKFLAVESDEYPQLGAHFRGAACNKIRQHRQMHNYFHIASNELPVPDFGVLIQFEREAEQVDRLYNTVKLKNYREDPLPEHEKESKRHENYLAKLAMLKAGQLGILPDIKILRTDDAAGARAILRPVARVKGISNARKSRQAFFDTMAA